MQAAAEVGLQLRDPALDRRVDVLVRVGECELAGLELLADRDERLLEALELGVGQQAARLEAGGVGERAGDVVERQLGVEVERVREALELGQERSLEATAPELSYGVSLFTSPTRDLRSRLWSWPWTCEAVRTPWPQSLMNPAAADWSNWSPLP